MHTEDEAKKTWCPMVWVAINAEHYHGGNRFEPVRGGDEPRSRMDGYTNCIASQCMMWRKHDQIGIDPAGKKVTKDLDGRTRWVDRGYCGLAGKISP